jgi:hypothetical protein
MVYFLNFAVELRIYVSPWDGRVSWILRGTLPSFATSWLLALYCSDLSDFGTLRNW